MMRNIMLKWNVDRWTSQYDGDNKLNTEDDTIQNMDNHHWIQKMIYQAVNVEIIQETLSLTRYLLQNKDRSFTVSQ